MRICIVTGAWKPQYNGVVTTLENTIKQLENWGHEVLVIHPGLFKNFPLPFYPEISIALKTPGLFKMIKEFAPHVIHIATEDILGCRVRKWCILNERPYTSAYHTRFPEYAKKHFKIPLVLTYMYMKWFHSKSCNVMVNTNTLKNDLHKKGFKNLVDWSRGVDTSLFKPLPKQLDLPGPIWLNVGRVSHEKNLEAFLKLDLPGTKVIVGDGPARKELEQKYPDVKFLGKKSGADLAQAYNECDVFVFPSKTDTFGLVIVEAMNCGKPVASFPVIGPIDIIEYGINGYHNKDLKQACLDCLNLNDKNIIIESVKKYTWDQCTKQFLNNLIPHHTDYSVDEADYFNIFPVFEEEDC